MAKTPAATPAQRKIAKAAGAEVSEAPPIPLPGGPTASTDLGADLGKTTLAAVAQANAALIESFGAIGEALYAYARDSFGSATTAARSMIEARSLRDVVIVNQEFAQAALEGLVANSARISEIGVKATSEVLMPLGERVADTIVKISRPTAR
jgi:phasin family protein